jgi:High potential iron-sulfur protein
MSLARIVFLRGIVVLPAAGLLPQEALADASKASQSSMHYQSTPNDGKHCSLCQFFIPGQDATSNGTCQVVDGSISPNGYCVAFSAKSSQ